MRAIRFKNNKFSQVYQRKMEEAFRCAIKCNAKLYTDKDGVFTKAVGGHIPKDVHIKRLVTHLHNFTVCFSCF